MANFGHTLRQIRENRGMSQEELAALLDTSKQVISRYELGYRVPKITVVKEFADRLGVAVSDLAGETELLPADVLPIKKVRIPLIGEIAAGVPILAEQDYESYVLADEGIRCDYALKVCGDSMINARIYDGDVVFIRAQPDVDDGDIAAIIIDDSVALKRVYHIPGGLNLVSENPRYRPMVFTEENSDYIRILGKAVAFQSQL